MKKIRFYLASHYVGGTNIEEIVQFENDITEEEIEEYYQDWVTEHTTQDTYWEEVEE